MADARRNWVRDLLIVPLIVGLIGSLIVAVVSWALTESSKEDRELSYSVDGPTTLIDQNQVGDVTLSIDGETVGKVVFYRVRVWNSGDLALVNVPVRFVFEPRDPAFTIFSVRHSTTPPHEFGEISEVERNQHERRFQYELLNPGSEDSLSFLTSAALELSIFAKAENLVVKRADPTKAVPTFWGRYAPLMAGLLGLVSALLSSAFWARLRAAREKTIEIEIERVVEETKRLELILQRERKAR